jgi:hypothetical protein
LGVIEVPKDIPEPDLEDWDPSKLPREMKIEVRREIHWFYWMQGKTYREIEAITGWSRWTIWEDIKWVMANLGKQPSDMGSIRKTALMHLWIVRAEILDTARKAQAREKVSMGHVAKLYEVAAGIDEHILTRYTPPEALEKPGALKNLEEQLKAMVKYVKHKLGPEGLDDFEDFFRQQLALQEALKVESKA